MDFLRRVFGESRIMDATVRRIEDADLPKADKNARLTRVLSTYEPFKLMQRLLALVVVLTYVLGWVLCGLGYLGLALVDRETDALDTLASQHHDMLFYPTCIILGLYFGGGVTEGVIERLRRQAGKKDAD